MPTIPELVLAPLPDWAAQLAPPVVRTASDTYGAALARYRELEHELRVAADAVDDASRADRQAAEQAVLKGATVPAATLPAAVEARERAQRAASAARDLAVSGEQALIRALAAGQPEYRETANEAHADLFAQVEALLGQLEAVCRSLVDIQQLESELAYPIGRARAIAFNVGPRGRRQASDRLFGSPAREHLTGLRDWAATQKPAGNTFVTAAA